MKKLLLLVFSLTAAAAFCQELLPELKPLAEKYGNDRLTLVGAPWEKAYAKILEPYSTALIAAQRDATTKGQLAVLKAIESEQEALGDGTPGNGAGLPKSVATSRATFLAALGKLNAIRALNTQKVDAAYLQALLALSTKSASNRPLLEQITSERKRVLSDPRAVAGAPAGKSLLVNGNFKDQLTNWEVSSKSVTVEAEGEGNFVRFQDYGLLQVVDVPAAAKEFTARVKMRVFGKIPIRNFGIFAVEQTVAGKAEYAYAAGTPGGGWKVFEVKGKIAAGITQLKVTFWGYAELPVDAKEVSLEIK